MVKFFIIVFLLLFINNATQASNYFINEQCNENLKFNITYSYLKSLSNEKLIDKANEAKACTNYKAVVKYDTEILSRQPNNYYIYNQRAIARGALEDYDGAISDYKKILSMDYPGKKLEHNAEIYKNIAWYYYRKADEFKSQEDYKAAIKNYTESIKLKPKNPEAFEWRGRCKIEISRTPFVLETFESGLLDLSYSKEQYLQLGDTEKYQKMIDTYRAGQELKLQLLRQKY